MLEENQQFFIFQRLQGEKEALSLHKHLWRPHNYGIPGKLSRGQLPGDYLHWQCLTGSTHIDWPGNKCFLGESLMRAECWTNDQQQQQTDSGSQDSKTDEGRAGQQCGHYMFGENRPNRAQLQVVTNVTIC